MLIVCYDEDKKGSTDLRHHELQGEIRCSMAELMCADGTSVTKQITKRGRDGNHGSLTLHAEEMQMCSEHVSFQISGKKVA